MNNCPCNNDKSLTDFGFGRPRLFNWITVLLVVLWVLVVTFVAEIHVTDESRLPTTQAFIEQLLL